METKSIKFGEGELLGIRSEDGKVYLGVRKACLDIGLNENQAMRQVKNINKDLVLQKGIKFLKLNHQEGNRKVNRKIFCLNIEYLPIWLSSINRKSLTKEQYKNIVELLNWCLSEDFDNLKTPAKIYSFESELRDEIYNDGYFNDIKITGKEISYDFGRIDLEGIDTNNNKYVIELKRYKEYNDVISQCIVYKQGFKKLGQDVKIIICQYDCANIIKEANKYGFECYEYKRDLRLNKVGKNLYE